MGSEPDDDLEARVERVEEQLSKTMPSRRQLLAGAGTLGVGALLGGGADTAAAADGTQDTSDGTVRGGGGGVDVRLDELRDPGGDEVFDVDDTGAINAAVSGREWRFDSVSTDYSNIGAEVNRPVISNEPKTIDVPGDYSTVQEAVNQIPMFVRNDITINLSDGTYSEDVIVPFYLGRDQVNKTDTSGGFPNGRVRIDGNSTDPSQVELNSIAYSGMKQTQSELIGIRFTGSVPYDNQDIAVLNYSGDELWAVDLEFSSSGAVYGVAAYNGTAQLKRCDFTGLDHGGYAKREGVVTATNNTGNTTKETYVSGNGGRITVWNDSTTSDRSRRYRTVAGGLVFTGDDRKAIAGGDPLDAGMSLTGVPSYLFLDDFGDGSLQSRDGNVTHPYPEVGMRAGEYRPEWKKTAGSASASSGAAVLSSGDRLTLGPVSTLGPWEIEFRGSGITSNAEQFQFYPIRQDDSNWIRVHFNEGGSYALVKNEAGSTTVLGSGSWPADTEPHSLKLERRSDPGENRWIVTVDGTEGINVTDSFVPNPSNLWLYNFWNNDVYVTEFRSA